MADMIDIENILEDDLMDALSSLGSLETQTTKIINKAPSIEKIDDITIPEPSIDTNINSEVQNINLNSSSSNIDDIARLLKELLNNKTIEITIKLKDN